MMLADIARIEKRVAMSTLYVRDVPDETKAVIAKIAAGQGSSVSEYVRQVLDDIAKTELKAEAIRAADAQLDAIHAQAATWPSRADISEALDEVRDEYERGDAP